VIRIEVFFIFSWTAGFLLLGNGLSRCIVNYIRTGHARVSRRVITYNSDLRNADHRNNKRVSVLVILFYFIYLFVFFIIIFERKKTLSAFHTVHVVRAYIPRPDTPPYGSNTAKNI